MPGGKLGNYRVSMPPVFVLVSAEWPPQIIIWVPVQTALCEDLGIGEPVEAEIGSQVFEIGLYLPPLLTSGISDSVTPPQIIISVPDQTVELPQRALGAANVDVADQVSVRGS